MKKIWMFALWIGLSLISGVAIWLFDRSEIGLGEVFASASIAIFLERAGKSVQDLFDNTDWKASQRKLKRGGFIHDNTIIRISFAYLYRINVGNKYLLVQNARKTRKYQPVGGVYKLYGNENLELKNRFQVKDDDKIPIDESSRDDYRLRLESHFLRAFVKRFDRKAERERINDISREFKEELIDSGIVDWKQISYRFCGRYISELKFGEHFQIYELLLADVVELISTAEQERDLRRLMENDVEEYRFATAEQINCLGMDTDVGELFEWIGDHTKKILQENEGNLIRINGVKKIYNVVF